MTPQHLRSSGLIVYPAALVLGLAAGAFLLQWRSGDDPPGPVHPCQASLKDAARLQGLANGPIAAFTAAVKPQKLPDLTFLDSSGQEANLARFSGKLVLLNLWATWCVPCREEMPALDSLQKKMDGMNFTVLPVSLDAGGAEKPQAFYEKIKIRFLPFYHDWHGTVFQVLRKAGLMTGLPTSILVNGEGCVLGTLAGPADWASKDAMALIQAAIAKY